MGQSLKTPKSKKNPSELSDERYTYDNRLPDSVAIYGQRTASRVRQRCKRLNSRLTGIFPNEIRFISTRRQVQSWSQPNSHRRTNLYLFYRPTPFSTLLAAGCLEWAGWSRLSYWKVCTKTVCIVNNLSKYSAKQWYYPKVIPVSHLTWRFQLYLMRKFYIFGYKNCCQYSKKMPVREGRYGFSQPFDDLCI